MKRKVIYTITTILLFAGAWIIQSQQTGPSKIKVLTKANTERALKETDININNIGRHEIWNDQKSEDIKSLETLDQQSKIQLLKRRISQTEVTLKKLGYPSVVDHLKPESEEFQEILNLLVKKETLRSEIRSVQLESANQFIKEETT